MMQATWGTLLRPNLGFAVPASDTATTTVGSWVFFPVHALAESTALFAGPGPPRKNCSSEGVLGSRGNLWQIPIIFWLLTVCRCTLSLYLMKMWWQGDDMG